MLFLLDTTKLVVLPCVSRFILMIQVTDQVKLCAVVVLSGVKLYRSGHVHAI